MVNQYVLLVAETSYDLNQKVNIQLKEGWQLTGVHQCAIAIQCVPDHPMTGEPYVMFSQAMVRS